MTEGNENSDDLYWGVQNLVDFCWRSKTENLQSDGKYLGGRMLTNPVPLGIDSFGSTGDLET